jgi:phosphoribosylaminoimidazole carboxylase
MLSSPKVGVLGGGQLGRMLVEAANRLDIQMNVLDTENAPAKQISAHDGHITGSFTDWASLRKLAEACDVLTTEIEHVDTYALEEVASEIKVEPSWKTIVSGLFKTSFIKRSICLNSISQWLSIASFIETASKG